MSPLFDIFSRGLLVTETVATCGKVNKRTDTWGLPLAARKI